MTGSASPLDPVERQRILDAALAELTRKGIDGFDLDGVAARAGVPPLTIKQVWANTPDLYSAAIIEFAQRSIVIPDTGSLRGDLLDYAKSYATAINSPIGRQLIDTVIVSTKDWDVADSRAEFRSRRHDRVNAMVIRGIERGECAPHIDPGYLMDLLGGCLCMSLLYYNRPITDEDCANVVDLLLNGAAAQR